MSIGRGGKEIMWISKKKYNRIMERLDAIETESYIRLGVRGAGFSPKEAVEVLYRHLGLSIYRTFPDIVIKEKKD